MTALRIAPALVAGALAAVLPASAAAPPRHYIVTGQNGSGTFTWSVLGGKAPGSHGESGAKFVGLGGTGILNFALGGGSAGGPLNVTRNVMAMQCAKGGCFRPPCYVRPKTEETGGVSFKVEGARVKTTPNFPFPDLVCAFTLLGVRMNLFEDLEKAGLLTKTVPLSLFAQKSFTLKLQGSVPIKENLPRGFGQMNGTYAWQFTVILERS